MTGGPRRQAARPEELPEQARPGLTATVVIEEFDLNYHLGSALLCILRAAWNYEGKRAEHLKDAIGHLAREAERKPK
jgi:hypothetical protein